jgi:SAM-dependent methyltransferase
VFSNSDMVTPKQDRPDSTRLDSTYNETSIHRDWRPAYHPRGQVQSSFDDSVYRWLLNLIKANPSWLDAGCGEGEHAFRLASLGCDVTCMDFSATALAVAQKTAPANIKGRLQFVQCALEDLGPSTIPSHIDNVHCRGVLMHIPDWRTAIRNLSRYVADGGYFVIFEGNTASLELGIVQLVRRFTGRKSKINRTPDGLEFWSEKGGKAFLVRMFDLAAISRELAPLGFVLRARRTLFLLDINRIPAAVRTPFRLLNRLWFSLNGPMPAGVVLVFRKETTPQK